MDSGLWVEGLGFIGFRGFRVLRVEGLGFRVLMVEWALGFRDVFGVIGGFPKIGDPNIVP